MLGRGCPWKGSCSACRDRYNSKNYCSSDSRWRQCPHRPLNDGNDEVARNYRYSRSNNETVGLFWKVVGFFVALWVVVKFILPMF